MAAAWVAYRTPEAAREWWGRYREECWVWRFQRWRVGSDGPVFEGHHLEQRPRPTLALFEMMQRHEPQPDRDPVHSRDPKGAIDALWTALRGSCFEATAIDLRSYERVTIPAEQWRHLEWFEERGRDVIRARDLRLNGGAQYQDVTVPMRWIVGFVAVRAKAETDPSGAG